MPNILTNIVNEQCARYGSREAIAHLGDDGQPCGSLSWEDLKRDVDLAACAYETLGLKPGDCVATFSPNRPEILVSDFATYYNGAHTASIYSTSSPEQVEYIINDSGARFLCVGAQLQYDVARSVASRCPRLERMVLLSPDIKPAADDTTAIAFASLLALGEKASDMCRAEVERRRLASRPGDLATLIYTSGTTGEPKGAELPHSCYNTTLPMHRRRLTMLNDQDTSLCFLPLCHVFEKAWTYFCLYMGMHVTINENPKEIAKAVRAVRPTSMCSVPRFWEKVYTGIHDKLSHMSWLKRKFIERGFRIGYLRNIKYLRVGKKVPWWVERLYRFYDKRVFGVLRKVVGIDRGNLFPTAGAPISANIVEFFRSIGVPMVVGYGLSETTATVSCFPDVGYSVGSVGTVMPQVRVKIASDGEILVKGPTVMRGYHNKPAETAAAFTPDGWFRTGDAGRFNDEGELVLTERIKDLFKTSNGKYIAPQAIESRLGEDPYIEQVAVIGDRRKYVTAIIIPAFEALKEYARKKKIEFKSIEDLIRNSEIIKLIADRIEKLQEGLANFEKIQKFTLLGHEFTIENGELTNTLKIRRPVISSRYAAQIEAMYC